MLKLQVKCYCSFCSWARFTTWTRVMHDRKKIINSDGGHNTWPSPRYFSGRVGLLRILIRSGRKKLTRCLTGDDVQRYSFTVGLWVLVNHCSLCTRHSGVGSGWLPKFLNESGDQPCPFGIFLRRQRAWRIQFVLAYIQNLQNLKW